MKTILQEFISARIKGYKEPTRKGTDKGDPIGLSKNKLKAACHMLKNDKIDVTAKKVNVSYALAKKWRTEKIFKDEMQRMEDKVAAIVANHLLDPRKMGKNFIPPIIDSTTYSKPVIKKIAWQFAGICTQERYVKMNHARHNFKGWYKLPRKERVIFYEFKARLIDVLLEKMRARYHETNGMRTIEMVGNLDTIYGWLDDQDPKQAGPIWRTGPTWEAQTNRGEIKH